MPTVRSVKAKPSEITFNDAIEKYYREKKRYEKPYRNEIEKLVHDTSLTNTQKQDKLAQFKRKCIVCGSLAGSVFKQEGNILIAHCGNAHAPCKLNIKLQKGVYENITTILKSLDAHINDTKIKTVKTKYDFLFGFSPERTTVEEFNKLKNELIEEVKTYQKIYEKYMSIINNLQKKKVVGEQNIVLLALLERFKELIKNFDETQQQIFLKEAMELYLNDITKATNMIRKLKYVYNGVYYDESSKTYQLVQDPYTQKQLLILVPGTEDKVLEYRL